MLYRFPSKGVLHYSNIDGYGYKLIVSVDSQIVELARALVPKGLGMSTTRYPPHISVVRKETPTNLLEWGKHEGEFIDFEYSPEVQYDDTYCWLRVFSPGLVSIRVSLGLPPSRRNVTCPPDGEPIFHTTIGNFKSNPVQE